MIDESTLKTLMDDNGVFHSDDALPAINFASGAKEFWKHGKLHNALGPAVVFPNHPEQNEYWIDGHQLSAQEFDDMRAGVRAVKDFQKSIPGTIQML